MKKTLIFVAMFSLLTLGVVAYSYAQKEPMAPSTYRSYETDALFGQSITGQDGQILGSLSDFVVDTNGHIVLAVIDHGPYENYAMKSGGSFTAVLFSSLVISGTQPYQAIRLNLDREKLASGSTFDEEKLMDQSWATHVYSYIGQQPTWRGTGEEFTLRGLLRKPVNDPNGNYLGVISDFVVDANGGNVLFAVIHKGTAGYDTMRTDAMFKAIPFTSLALAEMKPKEALVANIDEAKLELAPNFDLSGAMDPKWAGDAYRYFGQSPYWTEEQIGSARSSGRPDYFHPY